MNTVTIEIPDNMELIQEGDIYKLSPIKPKTWEEFCKSLPVFGEFFISCNSEIDIADTSNRRINEDRNLLESKEEAEAILALIQLIRLRKAWVGEWDPEPDWSNWDEWKYYNLFYVEKGGDQRSSGFRYGTTDFASTRMHTGSRLCCGTHGDAEYIGK